jgi:hypothetical protein
MKNLYTFFITLLTIAISNAQIAGTNWSLTPAAGSLGVGANSGDTSWWSSSDADVSTRACIFDDVIIFNADGTYTQDMQDSTWLEGWQGAAAEGCGTPIAPHNGSNAATYTVDSTAGTITVVGTGAHIGLAKVTNQGEDGVATNDTIEYKYELSADGNTMTIEAVYPSGVWTYKYSKNASLSVTKMDSFEFNLFPNPVINSLKVSSKESVNLVRVFDLTGRVVKQANPNKSNFDLDVSDLSKGAYLVKLSAGDKEATTKLIK